MYRDVQTLLKECFKNAKQSMIEPETIVVEEKRRDFWTYKEEKKRVSNTMNVILALANHIRTYNKDNKLCLQYYSVNIYRIGITLVCNYT